MRPLSIGSMMLLPVALLAGWMTAAPPVGAQGPNPRPTDPGRSDIVTEEQITTTDASLSDLLQLNLGWKLVDTDNGIRVEKIEKNSAAARASLQEGDVIVKINDENVRTLDRVHVLLEEVQQDDEVNITVLRDGEVLSYLLPLEGVDVVQIQRTGRSEQNITQMLQLIQQQLQAQQATLDAILAEMQTRQGQPAVNVRSTQTNVPPAGNYTGDVVVPLGGGTGAVTTPVTPTQPRRREYWPAWHASRGRSSFAVMGQQRSASENAGCGRIRGVGGAGLSRPSRCGIARGAGGSRRLRRVRARL